MAPAHCPKLGSLPSIHNSSKRSLPQPWGWVGTEESLEPLSDASAIAPSSWVCEVKHFVSGLTEGSSHHNNPAIEAVAVPKSGRVGGQAARELVTEHRRAKEGPKPEAGTMDTTTAQSHL